MELNDFKPLISEIVLYISEGRYDEVQRFLMKDGRLTLDTLRKEVEAFRGDYKVLPVSEKAFAGAKILKTFSRNVSSVYLTLFTEEEEAEEMSIGLYCGYMNDRPVVMIHSLMLQ